MNIFQRWQEEQVIKPYQAIGRDFGPRIQLSVHSWRKTGNNKKQIRARKDSEIGFATSVGEIP